MVAASMANGGDHGVRARWKSEGEEQAWEKDLEGCRRGLGDSSLSPRRCGGVGRRAGQAGTARGVRPRSVEQGYGRATGEVGPAGLVGGQGGAGGCGSPRPKGRPGLSHPLFFSFFFKQLLHFLFFFF